MDGPLAGPIKGLFSRIFEKTLHISHSLTDLSVDLHSHILPGIDDGSKSMEESLALIRALSAIGYKKLIITPHIMSDTYKNTSEGIRDALHALQTEVQHHNIDITLEAAAEYYLDEHFLDLLEKKEILTFGKNYLLFETSYTVRPYGLYEHIFAITSRGFTPVLAHPERYHYLQNALEEYHALKELGVLFQLNINSLSGYYSNPVKKTAEWLVDRGLIDFAGSDVHKMRHVDFLSKAVTEPYFQKLFEKNILLNKTLL
jgi:tyrosine-protein phosphatase YwqE